MTQVTEHSHECIYVNATLSISPLSPLAVPLKSVLYACVSIPALKIGSTVLFSFFLFYKYVCVLLLLLFVVQLLSCVQLLAAPWTAAGQASWSFTISPSLLKLMSIELVMPSNHLILCHPLLLPPSVFTSIRVFSNESALRIGWPKYWSFSFSPSNEHSGLISFRIGWCVC